MRTSFFLCKTLTHIVLFTLLFSPVALQASKLESLVMPGPLIEGHKKYEDNCSECHSSFSKTSQTKLCLNCHEKVDKDISSKKGFHGKNTFAKSQECKQCHTDHKGRDADVIRLDQQTFNHHDTDFPLKGKHKLTNCASCHKADDKFREADTNCYSCHKNNDPHDTKLGKKCGSCHSEVSWKKFSFDHSKTDFPLKGKHKDALCLSCHPDNRHKDTPKACYSCHILDDAHNTRYGKKCASCHNEKDWKKASFNHDKETKFKLLGKHKKVSCDSCHTGTKNIYKHKPGKTCHSCHKNDDIHKGKNGNKCQSCHSPKSWQTSQFSHNKDTKFPLRNKHAKLNCNACHLGSIHKNKLKTDCVSCHQVDDVHNKQLGTKCQNCHNDKGWNHTVKFNHDLTQFPLLGQHAITSCEECHTSHRFQDTSQDCHTCHAEEDAHKQTLGKHCHQCHNPNSWSLWLFDHNTQSRFPLDGSHKDLHCSACHDKPMESEVKRSSTCAACHYRDDVHRGGFGKNCEQCHTTENFTEPNL